MLNRIGFIVKVNLVLLLIVVGGLLYTKSTKVEAAAITVSPFPIGVGSPPYPSRYNEDALYTEIKDFGGTFVSGGNGANSMAKVLNLMTATSRNGLKTFSYDDTLDFNKTNIDQTAGETGLYVSSTHSLGQTFTSPTGTNWSLNSVTLNLDPTYWISGANLTVTLYKFGTPAAPKGVTLSSYTIPASQAVAQPVFRLGGTLLSNTAYYIELTSSASWGIGWVSYTVNSAAYTGGTAFDNGVSGGGDFYFKMAFSQVVYEDNGRPSDTAIDNITTAFKTNSGLLANFVVDEPSALKFTRLQAVSDRFRLGDSAHGAFVNLFPTYASTFQLGLDTADGEYVTPSVPLGQTFKANSITNYISTIQLNIDNAQWETNEYLTLKLWNSPAKTTLIAQSPNYAKPASNVPQFTLNHSVSPNTSYYLELVHAGGGDGSVGWVVRSVIGNDYYKDAQAYVGGVAKNADFWFTINQNISGGYEDYVYRWVATQPDVLSFDHYPFRTSGGVTSDYYTNLEIIRRQALLGHVDFWSYLQSNGEPGYLRVPNQHEMRYQIYTNLAYGAKGLQYFMYWNVDASETQFSSGVLTNAGTKVMAADGLDTMFNYNKQINGEVLKLGPTLTSLTSQAVYHTGTLPASTTALPAGFFWQPAAGQPLLISYFQNSSGRKYIMVVNRDYVNSRTVAFTLNTKPTTVTEVSKSTGLEVSTSYSFAAGTLSSSFAPGEGRLYALPVGY